MKIKIQLIAITIGLLFSLCSTAEAEREFNKVKPIFSQINSQERRILKMSHTPVQIEKLMDLIEKYHLENDPRVIALMTSLARNPFDEKRTSQIMKC